jgi:hypothetical protein
MKMENNRVDVSKEIEAVQISIYCEIVKNLLIRYRSMSIVKVVAFSFGIKKVMYLQDSCYTARNRSDLVLKYLSQISGCYDEMCEQLPYILQSIDLLIRNSVCELHETELLCKYHADYSVEDYGPFTVAAIQESNHYTDRQFWKEVISIV